MLSKERLKNNLRYIAEIINKAWSRSVSEFRDVLKFVFIGVYKSAFRLLGRKDRTFSIRYTVGTWYIAVLVSTVLIFCFGLYYVYASSLQKQSEITLKHESIQIESAIYSFWKAYRESEGGKGNWMGSPADSLFDMVRQGRFSELVIKWKSKTDFQNAITFKIIGRKGDVIVQNRLFDKMNESYKTVWNDLDPDRPVFQNIELSTENYQLITYPVSENGRIIYYIQILSSSEHQIAALRRFLCWLALMALTMVLMLAAVGWTVISQTMVPIDRMTRQARIITDHKLKRRLDIPHTGDELERLAKTLNRFLDNTEESFERLRRFSAAASHELRTPLTSMKGELEVILKRKRDVGEYEDMLRDHLKSVNEMANMSKELLSIAKAEAIDDVVNMEPFDMRNILTKAKEDWMGIASAKEIDLNIVSRHAAPVAGDRNLLERLVANLLDNALKHTPKKGRVSVRLNMIADEICLTVEDTGPGIPEENLEHIFDRFFYKDSGYGSQDSSGLGLGLCKWIAQIHKGRIDVSNLKKKGAVFTVWLPAHTAL